MEYLYKKTSDGAAEEKKPPLVIKNAKFVTSAATSAQFIKADKPMIAVCGKSNVGKSTFINMLAGQKQAGKNKRRAGRTRLVNYFDFGEFYLVDLPGYGYAEVSQGRKRQNGRKRWINFSKTSAPLRTCFFCSIAGTIPRRKICRCLAI